MKLVIVLAGMAALAAAYSFYETEDDYVDIDRVIADLPTLQAFADCFLDKGPCDSKTQSFKDIIPESMVRACDRCNVPQKQRYGRFLRGLRARLPHEYLNYRQKYDPLYIYMDALEAALAPFADQPLTPRPK